MMAKMSIENAYDSLDACTKYNAPHFGQYRDANKTLLAYKNGGCRLIYDDLGFGYEILLNSEFKDTRFEFFGITSQQNPTDIIYYKN